MTAAAQIYGYVDDPLLDWLFEEAERTKQTRSWLLRYYVEQALTVLDAMPGPTVVIGMALHNPRRPNGTARSKITLRTSVDLRERFLATCTRLDRSQSWILSFALRRAQKAREAAGAPAEP